MNPRHDKATGRFAPKAGGIGSSMRGKRAVKALQKQQQSRNTAARGLNGVTKGSNVKYAKKGTRKGPVAALTAKANTKASGAARLQHKQNALLATRGKGVQGGLARNAAAKRAARAAQVDGAMKLQAAANAKFKNKGVFGKARPAASLSGNKGIRSRIGNNPEKRGINTRLFDGKNNVSSINTRTRALLPVRKSGPSNNKYASIAGKTVPVKATVAKKPAGTQKMLSRPGNVSIKGGTTTQTAGGLVTRVPVASIQTTLKRVLGSGKSPYRPSVTITSRGAFQGAIGKNVFKGSGSKSLSLARKSIGPGFNMTKSASAPPLKKPHITGKAAVKYLKQVAKSRRK